MKIHRQLLLLLQRTLLQLPLLLMLLPIFAKAEIIDANSDAVAPQIGPQTSGLPAPIGVNSTVGSLPSSNQWVYDRTSSYLYLSYNTIDLKSPTITINHFQSDLGTSSFKYISLDSITRLFNLASPESPSLLAKFAFWGEVSLGMGSHDGDLYDTDIHAALPAESATLTTFFGKLGLQFVYEDLKWVKPYVGLSSTWFSYRHNSSMSGAVAEGGSSYYGPILGVHIPLTFLGKVSAYGEVRNINTQNGSGQLFASGTNVNGGVGFSF